MISKVHFLGVGLLVRFNEIELAWDGDGAMTLPEWNQGREGQLFSTSMRHEVFLGCVTTRIRNMEWWWG